MTRIVTRTAEAIGRGLVAGLAGTAAMTVSSTLEARVRGRGDSDTPAQAIETVVGADGFVSQDAKTRTNQLAHWGYGTSLGAIRGLLDCVGLGRNAADVAFHAAVWGAEQTMLPAMDLAPPATQWGGKEIASDLMHHTVYSLATNLAYRVLTPTQRTA